jgi:hypothetical protein
LELLTGEETDASWFVLVLGVCGKRGGLDWKSNVHSVEVLFFLVEVERVLIWLGSVVFEAVLGLETVGFDSTIFL